MARNDDEPKKRGGCLKTLGLGLLGLIVLGVVISALGGGETTDTGTDADGGEETQNAGGGGDGGEEGATGRVGKAITNAGTTYKVTNVRTTKELGDPQFGGARADGEFVVVTLQMTNNKDETKTFLESNAKIETEDGKTYETSDKAVLAFGDESLMLKDIQPDLTTKGKLAFELPPQKVEGSTLVIEDLFGDGEIRVDLGL